MFRTRNEKTLRRWYLSIHSCSRVTFLWLYDEMLTLFLERLFKALSVFSFKLTYLTLSWVIKFTLVNEMDHCWTCLSFFNSFHESSDSWCLIFKTRRRHYDTNSRFNHRQAIESITAKKCILSKCIHKTVEGNQWLKQNNTLYSNPNL